MLDVDVIYGGFPNPFDQMSAKITTKETSTEDIIGKETQSPEAEKETLVSDASANVEKPLPKA